MDETFKKNFIEHATKCWNQHLPFAYLTCLDYYKSGTFIDFENYSNPENFTKIEGGFRFKNSKYIYTFTDSLETQQRKAEELRISQVQIQNQRNQQYLADVQKIADKKRIADELLEAEWQKREKEKKEKLEAEKSQSSELNSATEKVAATQNEN
jgi:hypothetical protein